MSTRSETDTGSQSEHERHSLSMVEDGCSNELRFLITLFNKWKPAFFCACPPFSVKF